MNKPFPIDVVRRVTDLVGKVCERGLPEVNAALNQGPDPIQLSPTQLEDVRFQQGCYSDNIGLAALEAIGIDDDVNRIATGSIAGAAALVAAFGLTIYWAARR